MELFGILRRKLRTIFAEVYVTALRLTSSKHKEWHTNGMLTTFAEENFIMNCQKEFEKVPHSAYKKKFTISITPKGVSRGVGVTCIGVCL